MPTRVFHWALVGMVILAWVSSEADGSAFWIHVYSGTVVLGFVVFRIVWGVIGSRHALFKDFVFAPAQVSAYAKRLFAFRPPHNIGHNPLGGWMVLALLLVLVLTVLSGLTSSEDGYVGPLAQYGGKLFSEVHEGVANFLLILIGAHVAGVLVHGLISRENLPRAMITGSKSLPAGVEGEDIRPVGIIRPVMALALALAVVFYILFVL
jgi:cytochrome b